MKCPNPSYTYDLVQFLTMSKSIAPPTLTPIQRSEAFLAWFAENGGTWSPHVKLHHTEEFGFHVIATRDIPLPVPPPSNTDQYDTLVTCPLDLAITPSSCRRYVRFSQNCPASMRKVRLNERQWVVTYLTLHLIGMEDPEVMAS
jgi:hypothetical protein